jgi:hypothetical protein
MSLAWTCLMLAAGLGLAALSLWLQRRPREIGELAYPTTAGLALGLLLVILAVAHLISLETGQAFTGRMRL